MPAQELTLYTFAMSHFCEKIRWTLELCGLPFDEKPMTPVFHAVAAWRMGGRGRTSLPILKISHTASRVSFVQDSTRILAWLDRESGPFDLLPRCELAQDVSAIESRFDKVGQDVTRQVTELLDLVCRKLAAALLASCLAFDSRHLPPPVGHVTPRVGASRAPFATSLGLVGWPPQ